MSTLRELYSDMYEGHPSVTPFPGEFRLFLEKLVFEVERLETKCAANRERTEKLIRLVNSKADKEDPRIQPTEKEMEERFGGQIE